MQKVVYELNQSVTKKDLFYDLDIMDALCVNKSK